MFAHLERSPALAQIAAERRRQDRLWGEQNHPPVALFLRTRPATRAAEEYEISTADRARQLTASHADRGELTWAHILIEEVAEFVGASSATQMRAELVQVAAVAVAAIESLDRL